ncbi:MAG: hypothetical protein IJ774_07165 [Selenomonadaceae bacterium]|nr:hypothetical protein [Selenomonadaceae bacterium]
MDLQLDETLAANYKNASQKIRVISEGWLLRNLFCPCWATSMSTRYRTIRLSPTCIVRLAAKHSS